MLRLLADEHGPGSMVRGLLHRQPEVYVVRVQDVGLSGADDRIVRAWAASEARVRCPHDQHTVPKAAYERAVAGLAMPGVFVGATDLPVQQAVDAMLRLVECSEEHAWEGQGHSLPSCNNQPCVPSCLPREAVSLQPRCVRVF